MKTDAVRKGSIFLSGVIVIMDRVKRLIRYGCVQRLALTGEGVTVAVLDSGVAPHPDLSGKTILFRDFTRRAGISAYDDCGHGTHINGILCGSGLQSNGRFSGMAPGCQVINGKILEASGEGDSVSMLRALEWLMQVHQRHRIHILNLSIAVYNMDDRRKLAEIYDMLDRLSEKGVLVVTAAGNLGPDYNTISEIAQSSRVLTVGCHDYGYRDQEGNSCELHSGRGMCGKEIRKPDLVAPGTEIYSCAHRPDRRRGGRWGYTAKTGTSMSVPIVSGAAALLMQQYPQMGAYMSKRKIQLGTTDLHENYAKQGYGMLNMEKLLYSG